MRLWDALRSRLRSLFFRRRRDADLREELQFHLALETERLEATGVPPAVARTQALRLFGGLEPIAEECRDARGTGLVDDTIRDIRYALRGFRRAPLASLTIVGTVALGLGLVAVAFTVLNALVFRVDGVPDVHELFAVRGQSVAAEHGTFTRTQLEALRRDTRVFTDAYGEQSQVGSRVDGRMMFGTFVTGNFFQVLAVHPSQGRLLTPADDEPGAGQPAMVLSHRGWDRLFARDPAVLGRRVRVNGVTFEIVGVMPETFRGLMLTPDDYWAPFATLGAVRGTPPDREAAAGLVIVGRLKPGISRPAAIAQLQAWDTARAERAFTESGASRLTLVPRRGTVDHPLEAVPVAAPLFFAFGLILLIGCANVANLLLARGVARQREIGVQLSLGATRGRIVRQLLTESFLLSLVAAAAGFAISRVVLAVTIDAVMSAMPPDIGDIRLLAPAADWRVLLFLIAGAGVSTVAFALAPALQATTIEPVRTIRGEVVNETRPRRARSVLIALQVSASGLLLICAGVFLRSAMHSAAFDPGIRTSDTVAIEVGDEPRRRTIVQAVTAEPSVAAVAAWWLDPTPRTALAPTSSASEQIAYASVSPEFFAVLDIRVIRGRTFASEEGSPGLPVAVVSETTARALWPGADAVGQVLRIGLAPASNVSSDGGPSFESRTVTVVGVVRDVAGFRVTPFNKSVVYVPASAETASTALVARVHGDPELARQALLDRLTGIDPNLAHGVATMRTLARMDVIFLQLAFRFTIVLGGLALVLTLSGLFSVLSYVVAQRTREIGVRMALGATTGDVARLVLRQSMRPVGLGLLIGGGSAAGAAMLLRATPAAAAVADVVEVLDPVAYAVSLGVIVAACLVAASIPAARAARLDPALTLRQD